MPAPERCGGSLSALLRASSASCADRTAIVDGARALSYGELEAQSNRVAGLLVELGVSKGDLVGLYLEKSAEAVAAIHGIHKAGAAYVPLDPGAPVARLAHIVRDCGLNLILTGGEMRRRWGPLVSSGAPIGTFVVLNVDELADDDLDLPTGCRMVGRDALRAQPDTSTRSRRVTSQDLAYVLYTSGSTGSPKGVMLTHGNALAFVEWATREFALTGEDRLSSHAPLHFDLSIFDIFASVQVGAGLVLIPRHTAIFPADLVELIEREQITVWYSVPSALSMMLDRGNVTSGRLATLRVVLFAGEVFPPQRLGQLMLLLPGARFANLYGPTETNVCAWYEVTAPPSEGSEPVPIGKPIAGAELFVAADDGGVASPGEIGELCVQGPTVMTGYWGDAGRTHASLIRHRGAPRPDAPAYRTGDFVCEDSTGNYRLIGRRDHQIKTRGYRVELGEIEAALNAHPGVVECAVVALPDDLVTNRLAAVVVSDGESGADDLARFCAERIPAYMVPELFEFRRALPKTSTGKTDRQFLASELGQGDTQRRQPAARGRRPE